MHSMNSAVRVRQCPNPVRDIALHDRGAGEWMSQANRAQNRYSHGGAAEKKSLRHKAGDLETINRYDPANTNLAQGILKSKHGIYIEAVRAPASAGLRGKS